MSKAYLQKKKNPAPNILFTNNLKLVGQVTREKSSTINTSIQYCIKNTSEF